MTSSDGASRCCAPQAGTTATPTCALETAGSSKPTQCALICSPSALDGGCPDKASCKSISGTGLCTYDSVTAEDADALQVELALAAPATAHYEDPNAGPCQSGETAVQITGIAGAFCSPTCTGSTCPSDVPVRAAI